MLVLVIFVLLFTIRTFVAAVMLVVIEPARQEARANRGPRVRQSALQLEVDVGIADGNDDMSAVSFG